MSISMLDTDLLQSVAVQLLSADEVEVSGKRLRVRRTRASRLRCVGFEITGHRYEAIEQNPDKPSRWGSLPVTDTRSCSSRTSKRTDL